LKRYEILNIGGEEKLIVTQPAEKNILYYVTFDELFNGRRAYKTRRNWHFCSYVG
jgi:hypothetical protein